MIIFVFFPGTLQFVSVFAELWGCTGHGDKGWAEWDDQVSISAVMPLWMQPKIQRAFAAAAGHCWPCQLVHQDPQIRFSKAVPSHADPDLTELFSYSGPGNVMIGLQC